MTPHPQKQLCPKCGCPEMKCFVGAKPLHDCLSYRSGNSSPKNGLGVLYEAWRGVLQNSTISAVDILVNDLYVLCIHTIDAFKCFYNLKTVHFNAMLKISIKDKLVLPFSSSCFEPHFCHVIVTSFRMINTS
jgi:hypothetical protein